LPAYTRITVSLFSIHGKKKNFRALVGKGGHFLRFMSLSKLSRDLGLPPTISRPRPVWPDFSQVAREVFFSPTKNHNE
jgi:hypothetical protein